VHNVGKFLLQPVIFFRWYGITDEEIEEIDKLVPNGTLVEIRP